jgi:HD-GYP domain-containing protein (c-di-GMP phosphodiesterase class II)
MPSLSLTGSLAPIQSVLFQCLEDREPAILHHGYRVAFLAVRVGERMGFQGEDLKRLELAAGLHDVGKLLVPSFLVQKTIAFNREEYRIMQRHALLGTRLLESHAETASLAEVALHHHEHWDGHGYPGHLAGDHIPLPAQITAVVDAYDAMTSDRFGGNQAHEAAMEEVLRCKGTHFNPRVVEAFLKVESQACIPFPS